MPTSLRRLLCSSVAVFQVAVLSAQTPSASPGQVLPAAAAPVEPAKPAAAPANPFQLSPEERARLNQGNNEDHADMQRQLGITKLRPGRNPNAGSTNLP